MKRLAFLVATFGMASGSASAGLFTTTLSDTDAHQIRRLAVISVLGDTLHARQIGLTVFQNKSFDAAIQDWGLDATVMSDLRDRVIASGRITGDVVSVATTSSDTKTIIALARDQGFDAVLAVLPTENPNANYIAPGAVLLRRKLPGVDKLYACNGMALRIFRVSDGKQIGYAFPNSCTVKPSAPAWHDTWAQFTDEEKKATVDAVQSYIGFQVEEALSAVNIRVK
jgi:hypothetical protein